MLFLVGVVVVTLVTLYLLQKHNHQYWAKKGVVTDEPNIIFGNLTKVRRNALNFFKYFFSK